MYCTVVNLGLRQLVIVMGELEVIPPGVDVHALAEHSAGHRTALDVPPGPAESSVSAVVQRLVHYSAIHATGGCRHFHISQAHLKGKQCKKTSK